MFQAGGLVVVLVEVLRKNFLASIVPVIVNAVLNAHQLVVDIVAFVSRGDFPRSRLGEKQRGRILAGWVTRKMRTIAQFGIKDPDAADAMASEVLSRQSAPSHRNGSVRGGSSLKHVESSPALDSLQEAGFTPLPSGVCELPVADDSSIMESPPAEDMSARHNDGARSWPLPRHEDMRDDVVAYSPVEMPSSMWTDDVADVEEAEYAPQVAATTRTHGDEASHVQTMPVHAQHVIGSASSVEPVSLPRRRIYESDEEDEEYQEPVRPRGLRVANRTSDDEEED